MLEIENIQDKFLETVNSSEWAEFQEKFNNCDDIYVLGHGGNLAVADHTAIDISRLSNGHKNAIAPGSGVVATSLINDTDFDQWMVGWLKIRTANKTPEQLKRSLVYGISSSGKSLDVSKALQWGSDNGMQTVLITGQPISEKIKGLTTVLLNTKYYHTCEVLTLLLQYQLTHGSGRECPPIGKNKAEDLEKSNWRSDKIRQHSYPDELVNIAIDFDGVIHKSSKGYYDGTIYDEPVIGVEDALRELSKNNSIIIFTCKAKKDRGLVNGKTGTELVWQWLEKHNLAKYVTKVTAEKPRAKLYIDDKGLKFVNWQQTLNETKKILGE